MKLKLKAMDNDELQEGQTGTLKKPYLGYRHVEFCGVRLSAGSRAKLSSGLEISVWEDEVIWDEYYE